MPGSFDISWAPSGSTGVIYWSWLMFRTMRKVATSFSISIGLLSFASPRKRHCAKIVVNRSTLRVLFSLALLAPGLYWLVARKTCVPVSFFELKAVRCVPGVVKYNHGNLQLQCDGRNWRRALHLAYAVRGVLIFDPHVFNQFLDQNNFHICIGDIIKQAQHCRYEIDTINTFFAGLIAYLQLNPISNSNTDKFKFRPKTKLGATRAVVPIAAM